MQPCPAVSVRRSVCISPLHWSLILLGVPLLEEAPGWGEPSPRLPRAADQPGRGAVSAQPVTRGPGQPAVLPQSQRSEKEVTWALWALRLCGQQPSVLPRAPGGDPAGDGLQVARQAAHRDPRLLCPELPVFCPGVRCPGTGGLLGIPQPHPGERPAPPPSLSGGAVGEGYMSWESHPSPRERPFWGDVPHLKVGHRDLRPRPLCGWGRRSQGSGSRGRPLTPSPQPLSPALYLVLGGAGSWKGDEGREEEGPGRPT